MKYSRLALTLLLYTLSSATLWAVESQTTTFRNQQLNQEISGKQIEQQFVKKDWISLRDELAKYRLSKNHDPILADFVEASLLIEDEHRPDLALPLYEKILTQHPDYIFVRLAYAQALFADKQYALAEKQFAQIPEQRLHPITLQRAQLYRAYIKDIYKPQFNLNLNYEQNDNINQVGESDTFSACVFNECGLIFKKNEDSKPIKDKGIRWSAGVSKLFHMSGLHNLELNLQGDGIHYFKHSEYNEQSIRPSIAYLNRNSHRTWRVEPYADYQLFAGSIYKRQYGLFTEYQQNLTPNWQWRANYDIAKTSYNIGIPSHGNQHTVGTTLIYQGQTFYVYGGTRFSKENNAYDQLAHRRYSVFGGGQYVWNDTLGVQADVSVERRKYDAHNTFAQALLHQNLHRKETNYYAHLGVFSPKIEIYGFTPIINVKYTKTKSNLPELFNRDSWAFYLSVQKSF